jgi:hypothetical protein
MGNTDATVIIMDNRTGEVLLKSYNKEHIDQVHGGSIIEFLDELEDFEYHTDLVWMCVEEVIIKSI